MDSRPRTSTIRQCRDSYTISQLLEQISRIIPLQSDQWSLADYVVETGDYECLHFSQIDDVLNNDGEVRYVNLCLLDHS